jgi:hypothetical protein
MSFDRAAAWVEANQLNERSRACADGRDDDAALSWYRQVIDQVPAYEPAWFNMGLIREAALPTLDCNERAMALSGGEQGDPGVCFLRGRAGPATATLARSLGVSPTFESDTGVF